MGGGGLQLEGNQGGAELLEKLHLLRLGQHIEELRVEYHGLLLSLSESVHHDQSPRTCSCITVDQLSEDHRSRGLDTNILV